MATVWHNGAVLATAADEISIGEAERIARAIAHWTLDSGADASADEAGNSLLRHLNIHDPRHLNFDELYAARRSSNDPKWMSFPIGLLRNGQVLNHVIKARDKNGYGFHGLMPGTTNSGKSEMCLSAVYSLALTHAPTVANVVYVDMKKESAAQDLRGVPHCAAVLSDLGADNRGLAERMRRMLLGELARRQELCTAAGARDVGVYEEMRLAREANGTQDMVPIPTLWIVIDEYLTLFRKHKLWEDLIMEIGEKGRSARMHFILCGQRLELTSLRKFEDNIGYRMVLRAESESSSREWCGSNAAYRIPAEEGGHALLKVGDRDLVPFRCFYLSADFALPPEDSEPKKSTVDVAFEKPRSLTAQYQPLADLEAQLAEQSAPEPVRYLLREDGVTAIPATDKRPKVRVLDVLRQSLIEADLPVPPKIWLEPLEDPEPVDELVARWRGRPWSEAYGHNDGLFLLAGIEDDPFMRKQDVHALNVGRDNVMVVGTKGAGKTTALMTLVASGCLLYRTGRVTFMCIGEAEMYGLAEWPHVADVVGRDDSEGVRVVVATLEALRRSRAEAFKRAKGMTIEKFREAKFEGATDVGWVDPEDDLGDVFLVIDDFNAFAQKYEMVNGLADRVVRLAQEGPEYGIHLIVSQSDWISGMNDKLKNVSNERIELMLSDPTRTETNDREAAKRLTAMRRPGFAITRAGGELNVANEVLVGVPALTDTRGVRVGGDSAAAMVASVAGTPKHFRVKRLPKKIGLAEFSGSVQGPLVPFGIGETGLQPVCLDWSQSANFLITGLKGCGKDTALKALLESVTSRFSPQDVRLHVFDPTQTLVGAVADLDPKWDCSYHYVADDITTAMVHLNRELAGRLAPAGLDWKELRDWQWSGPHHVVFINDEDQLGDADQEVLRAALDADGMTQLWGVPQTKPLTDLVKRAGEIGLHVIAARHPGNWEGVSMSRPFVVKMIESRAPILFMNNDPDSCKVKGRIPAQILPPGRGLLVHDESIEGVLVGYPTAEKELFEADDE